DDQWIGSVPYSMLLGFARGIEKQLDDLQIPLGANVATLFQNCGLAALLFFAVIYSRRVLVPINPSSTSSELDWILDRSKCVVLIADPTQNLPSDLKA